MAAHEHHQHHFGFRTLGSDIGSLYVRTLGTQKWTWVPFASSLEWPYVRNVVRPTFQPGMMSVILQNENAAILDGRLGRPLYLWKSTFSFQELNNVRVKEVEIERYLGRGLLITRIELLAVCKAPPAGHLLETKVGVNEEMIYNDCIETSNPVPSGWRTDVAELSDRWRHGFQEIRLTFTRASKSVQLVREPPQDEERVAGTMHWSWNAFFAFLGGSEWIVPTREAVESAVQMSLKDVVASRSDNPFAELEKVDDDWILIKPKFAHQAPIERPPVIAASTLSSSLSLADLSASTAPLQSANVSQSVSYEKRKEVGDGHEVGRQKRRKLESRSQSEGERVEVGARAQTGPNMLLLRPAGETTEQEEKEQFALRLSFGGLGI